MEGLTSLIDVCLLPMLMFVQILKGFDIMDFEMWAPVLGIILIQVAIGVILGYVISYITFSERNVLKFLITSLSFTQTKTLQLLLVDNLAGVLENISLMSGQHYSTGARNRALNYVLVSYLIENMLRYSLGSFLLKPGPEEVDESKGQRYSELNDEASDSRDLEALRAQQAETVNVQNILNASFVAFIIATILSKITVVKTALLDEQSIINETLFVSSDLIGKTVKVMTVFVFGAALPCYSWESAYLSQMVHVLQALVKLIVYPILGLYIVFDLLFQILGWVNDPILVLMMSIHFAAPTGMGMLTLVGQNGYLESDMGKSLTIQHLGAILTFTLSNALFLFLISNYYQMNGMGMDIKI